MLRGARACAVVRINSDPDTKIPGENRSVPRKITRFGGFLLVGTQDREFWSTEMPRQLEI